MLSRISFTDGTNEVLPFDKLENLIYNETQVYNNGRYIYPKYPLFHYSGCQAIVQTSFCNVYDTSYIRVQDPSASFTLYTEIEKNKILVPYTSVMFNKTYRNYYFGNTIQFNVYYNYSGTLHLATEDFNYDTDCSVASITSNTIMLSNMDVCGSGQNVVVNIKQGNVFLDSFSIDYAFVDERHKIGIGIYDKYVHTIPKYSTYEPKFYIQMIVTTINTTFTI